MKENRLFSADELQSKVIDFLRFPLILIVILIHSKIPIILGLKPNDFPIYFYVQHIFSQILGSVAVPLFFFISGFLFFYKLTDFTTQDYIKKLKNRFRTLFIPYVLWNIVYILIFFLAQTFAGNFMSGKNKLFQDYSFMDWIMVFWNTSYTNPTEVGDTFPINISLWFIRDLMVTILLSPMIFFLIKKLKQYFVLILGVLWIFGVWVDMVSPTIDSLFFFSYGAFFSIYRLNFVEKMKPYFRISGIAFFLLGIAELLLFDKYDFLKYLYQVRVILGIVFFITFCADWIQKKKIKANQLLTESSFFIYAYHILSLIHI